MKITTKSMKYLLSTGLAASLLAGCASVDADHQSDYSNHTSTNNEKTVALNALDALFKNYDAAAVRKYLHADYIQHNPHVPTGREAIVSILPNLKQAGTTAEVHRVIQDGQFVVMHTTFDNAESFGAKELVAFDVWRLQDGQIAEHWDNLQPLVQETASGRSQVDGPTKIVDKNKTESNKTIVRRLMTDVFFGANPQKISDYISAEQYDQHNPNVADGLNGLLAAIEYLSAQNNMFIYQKVHKVLGEGNFVFVMSEGSWNGKPHAFFDLFRLENNKIVEHWDVVQDIPAKMAHANGKF